VPKHVGRKLIAEYIIYRIVHLFGADTVCKSVHNAWNEEQYARDLN
jgi:hypothetical protein